MVPGHVLLLPWVQHLFPRALPLWAYPDVRYLSGCDGIRGASAPFFRTSPHVGLSLSGVTPLRWALHQLGGGVMLPNWCNAPKLVHGLQDSAAMSPSGTRR